MPGIWQILIVENEFQAGRRSVISAQKQTLKGWARLNIPSAKCQLSQAVHWCILGHEWTTPLASAAMRKGAR
jgi:hypothetical protein